LVCFAFITIGAKNKNRTFADKAAFAAALQITVFIITASLVATELSRFLYPLFSYVVILVCWGISRLISRKFKIVLTAILVFYFAVLYAWKLGLTDNQIVSFINPKLFRRLAVVRTSNAVDESLTAFFEAIDKQVKTKQTIVLAPTLPAIAFPKISFYKTVFFSTSPQKIKIRNYPCSSLRRYGKNQEKINHSLWGVVSNADYYLDFSVPIFYRYMPACRLNKKALQKAASFIEDRLKKNKRFTRVNIPNHPEIVLYKREQK